MLPLPSLLLLLLLLLLLPSLPLLPPKLSLKRLLPQPPKPQPLQRPLLPPLLSTSKP